MRPKGKDDVIAGLDMVDPLSRLDDDARGLVPEHHRQGQRPISVHDLPIAHANTGGLHLSANLSGLRRILLEIENL